MSADGSFSNKRMLWIAAPSIAFPFAHQLYRDTGYHGWLGGRGLRRFLSFRKAEFRFSFATDSEGMTFVWNSENQRRVLEALAEPLEERIFIVTPDSLRRSISGPLRASARALAVRFAPATATRASVNEQLVAARSAFQAAQQFISLIEPKNLVLASQQHALHRSLTWLAQQSGLPTVYVPHAPTATNIQYRDIPFNSAFLRGGKDADLYRAWGAKPECLKVVGDPSWQWAPAEVKGDNRTPPRIVLAPSPWSQEHLEWLFKIVHGAGILRYDLIPHPASDVRLLNSMRSSSSVLHTQYRTAAFLAEHKSVVIQSNSGVALEALLLGRPVIDVRPHDMPANYEFATSLLVHQVHDSESLRVELSNASKQLNPNPKLVEYGNSWVTHHGKESQEIARRLLPSVRSEGSWALDAWKSLLMEGSGL